MIDEFALQFNTREQRLELLNSVDPKFKPFYLDFTAGKQAYRIKQGIGRQQALARAVGLKKNFIPTVFDATAGLGRDAFLLAFCACEVILTERHPWIYALLEDALKRAAQTELAPVIARMQLHGLDAKEYLTQTEILPDVIYLDPMFPERSKTALVKQELRIVRALVGGDQDIEELFNLARAKAQQRVVVKRHRLSDFLAAEKPDHQIIGKTTRYDVYLTMLSPENQG